MHGRHPPPPHLPKAIMVVRHRVRNTDSIAWGIEEKRKQKEREGKQMQKHKQQNKKGKRTATPTMSVWGVSAGKRSKRRQTDLQSCSHKEISKDALDFRLAGVEIVTPNHHIACLSASSSNPGTMVFCGEPLMYVQPSNKAAVAYLRQAERRAGRGETGKRETR